LWLVYKRRNTGCSSTEGSFIGILLADIKDAPPLPWII
jgi:hypothetical protein